MFKINLHDTLRGYNEVKPLEKKEELLLKEANKLLNEANEADIALLAKLGMDDNFNKGKALIWENEKAFEFKEVYDISVIKRLAINYRLRFLSSNKYNGIIDPALLGKIKEFLGVKELENYNCNFYVLAPPESFKLEERPIDPIMFYKISDSKFAYVHKWGNDLTWLRLIIKFPLRSEYHLFISTLLSMMIISYNVVHKLLFNPEIPHTTYLFAMFVGQFFSVIIACVATFGNDYHKGRYIKTSDKIWNSNYC